MTALAQSLVLLLTVSMVAMASSHGVSSCRCCPPVVVYSRYCAVASVACVEVAPPCRCKEACHGYWVCGA